MLKNDWTAISARIGALFQAGEFLARTDRDTHSLGSELLVNGKDVVETISRFCVNYDSQLSEYQKLRINAFIAGYNQRFDKPHNGEVSTVLASLTMLASFRAEFDYLVSGIDSLARSLVSRAFAHLQNSIRSDEQMRDKWKLAFKAGETECEKLGACHLLLHGIWAFKASGEGERTDLVLGTPLEISSEIRRAADALVLTEWKVVKQSANQKSQEEQALEQARRYSAGVLAGFELASRRYLVIVSDKHIQTPNEILERNVTYEYVNVAVNPSPPSRS